MSSPTPAHVPHQAPKLAQKAPQRAVRHDELQDSLDRAQMQYIVKTLHRTRIKKMQSGAHQDRYYTRQAVACRMGTDPETLRQLEDLLMPIEDITFIMVQRLARAIGAQLMTHVALERNNTMGDGK